MSSDKRKRKYPDNLNYPPERGTTADAFRREDVPGKVVLGATLVVLSPLLPFVKWLDRKVK